MTAVRNVDGLRFESQGDKRWVTSDGLWVVEYVDDFETECDNPHPMRVGKEERSRIQKGIDAYGWRARTVKFLPDGSSNGAYSCAAGAYDATLYGKRGYQCEGLDTHFYALWVSGAAEGEPQVISRDDKMVDAMHSVALHIKTGEIWA